MESAHDYLDLMPAFFLVAKNELKSANEFLSTKMRFPLCSMTIYGLWAGAIRPSEKSSNKSNFSYSSSEFHLLVSVLLERVSLIFGVSMCCIAIAAIDEQTWRI